MPAAASARRESSSERLAHGREHLLREVCLVRQAEPHRGLQAGRARQLLAQLRLLHALMNAITASENSG